MFSTQKLPNTQKTATSRYAKLACVGAVAIVLSACSDDDVVGPVPFQTGVFQDAGVVEGLTFQTDTVSGVTNENGEFNFNPGEEVTFSLAGIDWPPVLAASSVSALSIFNTEDLNDPRVESFSQVLQSLDIDQNPINGITLPDNVTEQDVISAGASVVDVENLDAASIMALVNSGITTDELANSEVTAAELIDAVTASNNLDAAMGETDAGINGCSADHPFVGRTSELDDLSFHGVSGTVTVLDDCTLEVTNFFFDGGGIEVFFYGANDRNFRSSPVVFSEQQLVGTPFAGGRVMLTIPEGRTLDDMNSLSVWCAPAGANFGDTFFGDL